MKLDDTGEIFLRYNPKKKSKAPMIICIVLAVLILAAVSVLVYKAFFSTDARLGKAYDKLNAGDLSGAISDFDALIAQDNKNIEAYAGKATAQIQSGDDSAANDTVNTLWVECTYTDDESNSGNSSSGSSGNSSSGESGSSSGESNTSSGTSPEYATPAPTDNTLATLAPPTDGGGNSSYGTQHTPEPTATATSDSDSGTGGGSDTTVAEVLRYLFIWQCKYNITLDRGEQNEITMETIEMSGLNAMYNIYTRPAMPSADPQSGTYDKPITVKLSSGGSGTICYLVGTEQLRLKKSTIYSEPIYIKKNNTVTHIMAAVYDDLLIPSNTLHLQYELSRAPLSSPTASKESGSYSGGFNLTLKNPNDDGSIYYTTDGSEPTASSKQYSGKIYIGEGSTAIKAKVIDTQNDISSGTIELSYKVTIPKPTAAPKATEKPSEGDSGGCPKCGSSNITLVGNYDKLENQIARCLDCGYRWNSGTKVATETEKPSNSNNPACPSCGSKNTEINPKTGYYRCNDCGAEDSPEYVGAVKCPNCGSYDTFEFRVSVSGGTFYCCNDCNYEFKP